MPMQQPQVTMSGFSLGRPALVCRWRLANRALPLENRHLRALSRRTVNGAAVSAQLVAWAKQHIEWTLADGAALHPDGVLMTVIDESGNAAMAVGPYEPLGRTTALALARRAARSAQEAEKTGVSPETLWALSDGRLLWGVGRDEPAAGTASLVLDLARALGFGVERAEDLAVRVIGHDIEAAEVFLASDEHGVVLASNAQGPSSRRFAAGYEKLLATKR